MSDAADGSRRPLTRVLAAFDGAGIPYAVGGDHAAAAWLESAGGRAKAPPRRLDVIIREPDLSATEAALANAGFISSSRGSRRFVDRTDQTASVEIYPTAPFPAPGDVVYEAHVIEAVKLGSMRVLERKALVTWLLGTFEKQERIYLKAMVRAGLIDRSWKLHPPLLEERLHAITRFRWFRVLPR